MVDEGGDYADESATQPVFVGIFGVGFVVDKAACEPVERYAVRVYVTLVFVAPMSVGGSAYFDALGYYASRNVYVKTNPGRQTVSEYVGGDVGDEGCG